MAADMTEVVQHIKKLEEAQIVTNRLLQQMLDYWKSLEYETSDTSYHEARVKEGFKTPEEKKNH